MADKATPDPQRVALGHQHSLAAISVDAVGMPLGMWAGRGDYARFSQVTRDRAGQRALNELDEAITQLTAFRAALATALAAQGEGGSTPCPGR